MDINKLDSWSKNWCLMFNSTKCKVMSLGRSRIPPVYTMSLCDGSTVKLECTNLEKDLGIMIDSGLMLQYLKNGWINFGLIRM